MLRSADAAALAISSRDAAVLAALSDVRFSLSSSSSSSPSEGAGSRELRGKREQSAVPSLQHAAPPVALRGISFNSFVPASCHQQHCSHCTACLPTTVCCLSFAACLSQPTFPPCPSSVELEFLPSCKHLAPGCSKLVKDYSFQVTPGGEPYLLSSRVAAAPTWASPALDPTHKTGRDGKPRPASSIFQLLKQSGGKYAFNLTGAGEEVQVRWLAGSKQGHVLLARLVVHHP